MTVSVNTVELFDYVVYRIVSIISTKDNASIIRIYILARNMINT